MSAKRHERTLSRRAAMSVLYSAAITEDDPLEIAENGVDLGDDIEDAVLDDYALLLLRGVKDHMDEIDARLGEVSENWSIDRMPIVDRSILRLAVYEMLYVDEVPVSVVINEAVELAKDFGCEDDSHRFVNGVLGKIALLAEGEAGEAAEAADEQIRESEV